jgi:DNA-binding NarL/FixJ family response regulator
MLILKIKIKDNIEGIYMYQLIVVDNDYLLSYWVKYSLHSTQSELNETTEIINTNFDKVQNFLCTNKTHILLIMVSEVSSLTCIRKIQEKYNPYIITIIDKSMPLDTYLYRLYKLNIHGLMDNSGFYSLNEAIATVLKGYGYIQPNLSHLLVNYVLMGKKTNTGDLTNREYEVMRMTSKGFSNQAIAVYLGVCRRTISNDKKNILSKLKASSIQNIIMSFKKDLPTQYDDK